MGVIEIDSNRESITLTVDSTIFKSIYPRHVSQLRKNTIFSLRSHHKMFTISHQNLVFLNNCDHLLVYLKGSQN